MLLAYDIVLVDKIVKPREELMLIATLKNWGDAQGSTGFENKWA